MQGKEAAADRRRFRAAPAVSPPPISGDERPDEIIAKAFSAYVGRQERTAFELMRRSLKEKHAVFLTLSGAMTPAGLHQSCIIPLLERGAVDCLVTTGANLYHDAHRVLGHRIREINPAAGDLRLRRLGIIRIYDLGFGEDVLFDTDRFFSALLRQEEFQRRMTTPELHHLLGKHLAEIESALGVAEPSLLASAFRARVPIFVGAPADGSIFLNMVKLKKLLGDAFRLEIDAAEDVYLMGALQHYCASALGRKLAIWILGGGVPKNYTLQGEPLLGQILEVETEGFDIDVQFCVDPVDNGALSSCPASEGHTWGKISAQGVERSAYVHCDVTAVFPWLTYALFSPGAPRKKGLKLMDHCERALKRLDAQVAQRRSSLLRTTRDRRIGRRT
ncbi:MAG: deoxyhypusine synthase family protein [Planctomycetes bacterium]|nr:deoxyhypusine synthase family protein [Planctomycetota bacterium]